jgi:hypothetical protein
MRERARRLARLEELQLLRVRRHLLGEGLPASIRSVIRRNDGPLRKLNLYFRRILATLGLALAIATTWRPRHRRGKNSSDATQSHVEYDTQGVERSSTDGGAAIAQRDRLYGPNLLQESPSFTTQAELLIAQAALLRPRPLTCHSQDNLVLHPSSESQFQEFKS